MQAILEIHKNDADGKAINERLLFDTEKSVKVCDVINTFGYAVQTIFLSPGGILFLQNNNRKQLKVADQEEAKNYIGENYPERFIEVFGEVEEA